MSRKATRQSWYLADLHLHTPASSDYQEQASVSMIDVLRRAEAQGLDIIAITDHNTVSGYAGMLAEVERLGYLQQIGRAQADELRLLAEYRRLLEKILVLPGFEFTATFGFHILGIFAPDTPIRLLEHLLLSLNVPLHALDVGSSEVGASSDVLSAYRAINEAGGICIAAHANSTHGVAMVGLDFGGQTRIAYTQDRNVHALEVTDLNRRDNRSTARFFDGSKAEYPRKMRCIQGSDAHRLDSVRDRSGRATQPGIGERITEFNLPERTFGALLQLFQSGDFSRSRPYTPNTKPQDFVQQAREEGPSVVQAFHESMDKKNGSLDAIILDVCAFLNTNGGTIYVGVSPDKKKKPTGIDGPRQAAEMLERELRRAISPAFEMDTDVQETSGVSILRIQLPFGEERPYAIDQSRIYVRDEAETNLAVRDEIVNLVRQGLALRANPALETMTVAQVSSSTLTTQVVLDAGAVPPTHQTREDTMVVSSVAAGSTEAPRSGVEIISVEERDGTRYYAMRDLRNGNVVRNVTRSSSRLLWHYAILKLEEDALDESKIQWHGDIGLVRTYTNKGVLRCDLVQRLPDGTRVYYGVAEKDMEGAWSVFLTEE